MDFFNQSSQRKVCMLLARSYVLEGRFQDAVLLYLRIINDCPQEVEARLALGNLYLFTGSPRTAQALYQQVLDRCPAHLLALRQLTEAAGQAGCGWEEKDPLSPPAVARLSARLEAGFGGERLAEIASAVEVLEKCPESQQADAMRLLMPALVEMNIRQARAEGYTELAESLRALQANLARRLRSRWEEEGARRGTGELRAG